VNTYNTRYVLYRRVSHAEQGRSGLGLEAQKRDLELYLAGQPDAEVLADFVEVASGAKGDRPALLEALALCRKQKATLLVSKLDRLSRNVAFVATLLEERGVEFVVASLPQASRFELHLYAALAEQERTFISQRTNKN
jgi:DNA invertase Pin-like site-specific DNA recombinase